MAGFIACLVGTLTMFSGRFVHGAPVVLVYVGVSGIVFGWGLLGMAVVQRAALLKSQGKPDASLGQKG